MLLSADASAGCVSGMTSASMYLMEEDGIVKARLSRIGLPGLIFTFLLTGPRRTVSDVSTVWSEEAYNVTFTVPVEVTLPVLVNTRTSLVGNPRLAENLLPEANDAARSAVAGLN